MAKVPVIDIRPCDLETVREVLRRHVPNHEVLAFGSRVRWTARQYSDLDLAIRSDEAIPTSTIYAIKNELSESNLPMMVDVLDMASVSEKFRGIIEEEYAVVQETKSTKPLSEVAEITMGQSPPGNTYNKEDDGLPFYQGVADFQERYPKRRVYCTAPTRFAERGDILLSVRAPIGRVNLSIERCAIGRGLARIRANDSKDQTFLEFALRGESANWDILESQGSVFGSASKSDLMDLPIPWPAKKDRRFTARILGALDDKIELNRRMNQTLEAMVQAIFKSWFVDFDPVHAKAKNRNPGLPPEIADLFPDRFEDSELGKIPRGWEVKPLEDVAEIKMGQSPPGNTYNEGGVGIPFYQGVADFQARYPKRRVFCDAPTRFAEPGDILLSVRAPIGRINLATERCAIGRGLAGIRATDFASQGFLEFALRKESEHWRILESQGSVFGNAKKSDIIHLPILWPGKKHRHAIAGILGPLCNTDQMNGTLAGLRDTLIPGLLSGKIPGIHCQ